MLVVVDSPGHVINDLSGSQLQLQHYLFFCPPEQPFFFAVLFFESRDCVKRVREKEKKNCEEDSSDPLLKRFRVRISRWLIYHGATQSLIRIPAGGVAML